MRECAWYSLFKDEAKESGIRQKREREKIKKRKTDSVTFIFFPSPLFVRKKKKSKRSDEEKKKKKRSKSRCRERREHSCLPSLSRHSSSPLSSHMRLETSSPPILWIRCKASTVRRALKNTSFVFSLSLDFSKKKKKQNDRRREKEKQIRHQMSRLSLPRYFVFGLSR